MTDDETLNKKELAYALALRDVKPSPTLGCYQTARWRELRAMIRDDYVRPSRHDRFNAVSERGQ
jgi:hypothetical protein